MIWTERDYRREQWTSGGWNLADDDVPRPPEPSPLSSAQSRRAWREDEPVREGLQVSADLREGGKLRVLPTL